MKEAATDNKEKKRKTSKFNSMEVGSLKTIHIQVALRKPPCTLGEPKLFYNILLCASNISSHDIPQAPRGTTGQAIVQFDPINLAGDLSKCTEQEAMLALKNPHPFFWANSTEKQKPFSWVQTPQPASPGTTVSHLGGRCRAALFPNALEADFPTVPRSLTTQQASPLKTLTPSLPGLNPCNPGLFLRCLQSAAGPGSPRVTGGTSRNYNTCRGWPVSLSDLGAERTIICGCLLQRMLCLDFISRPRAQVLFCSRLPGCGQSSVPSAGPPWKQDRRLWGLFTA